MRAVHVVTPAGIDDPRRPSGGNTYDRRLCQELAAAGWAIDLRPVPGDWPHADAESRHHLAAVLAGAPDGATVVLDGLVALAAPEVVAPAGLRLRTVVIVHAPLDTVGEDAVLRSAAGIVCPSEWTRRRLLSRHRLDPARVHVVPPGVDAASPATGSRDGGSLLCVGAVIPAKGHDLLVAALGDLTDLPWRCVWVGSLDRDPAHVAGLRAAIGAARLHERLELVGPLTGRRLDAAYGAADVLVHASRSETYGMVVTEALARGLPVLACDVGGLPEALGTAPDGTRPGVLTPEGDAAALARSLRGWLTDADLRARLRATAHRRRSDLAGWDVTGRRVGDLLVAVAA
jgi:glycosyltransferase involved in cell wall biosynthesis